METPVEKIGDIFVKRDDLYLAPGGAPGGKARTCYSLAKEAKKQGFKILVTAGSRSSPQVNIVAQIGKALGLQVRIHTPSGEPGVEVINAEAAGAVRFSHKPGYNTVIVKRAEADSTFVGGFLIPFGMECEEAVTQTASSFSNVIPHLGSIKRIVVPVGSGMSLCGILKATYDLGISVPIVGVSVGADPQKRLNKFAPMHRFQDLQIIKSELDYHEPMDARVGDIELDPVYEAKCFPYLEPNDLFWIVGIRQTLKI